MAAIRKGRFTLRVAADISAGMTTNGHTSWSSSRKISSNSSSVPGGGGASLQSGLHMHVAGASELKLEGMVHVFELDEEPNDSGDLLLDSIELRSSGTESVSEGRPAEFRLPDALKRL
jgi:hypothetical protein